MIHDALTLTTGATFYSATTSVTISNGKPNAVMQIQLPQAGQTSYGLLSAVGADGTSGNTFNVTLDANGNGSFTVKSNGLLPPTSQIAVPITILERRVLQTFPATMNTQYEYVPVSSVNIALQPANFIVNVTNYIKKLGWAILAGPGNSADEIAADMAFSFIPVAGVYSDIRDAASEIFKWWSGDPNFDWKSLGLSVAGIIPEVSPPLDNVIDGIKTAKKVGVELASSDASVAVIAYFSKMLKDFDFKNALASIEKIKRQLVFFTQYLSQPSIRKLGNALQDSVDSDAIAKLSKILNGTGDNGLALLNKLGDEVGDGVDAIRRTVDELSSLDPSQLKTLSDAGKLDVVADGIAKHGWDGKTVKEIAPLLANLPPGIDPLKGFASFKDFKSAFGEAGPGQAWHHIVEQTINSSKIPQQLLQNPGNLIKLPHGKGTIHTTQISAFYSSKQPFSGGLTVREWISKKSYKEQFDFGVDVIKNFGGSKYLPPN